MDETESGESSNADEDEVRQVLNGNGVDWSTVAPVQQESDIRSKWRRWRRWSCSSIVDLMWGCDDIMLQKEFNAYFTFIPLSWEVEE